MVIDLADAPSIDFSQIGELAEKGHKHYLAFVHRFGENGALGLMDCLYSCWTTRRDSGFSEPELEALRDLVPVLGLAIKSAQQVDIARTLGRVYLGRDAFSAGLGRAHRTRRHRAHQRRAVVFGFARLDRDQREHRPRRDHPVPQRLCPGRDRRDPRCRRRRPEADRRWRARDVLRRGHVGRRARCATRRASVPQERRCAEQAAGGRGPSHHVRLYRPACRRGLLRQYRQRGPARLHRRRPDRQRGQSHRLDEPLGRSRAAGLGGVLQGPRRRRPRYLVSTGRYALRGIGRAQDLYTLDPEVIRASR